MKRFLLAIMVLIQSVGIFAETSIELRKSLDSKDERERSSYQVRAIIDQDCVVISFTVPTASNYYVTECMSDSMICSGSFAENSDVSFMIPDDTQNGTYQLCVYAYGCWWTGTFVY